MKVGDLVRVKDLLGYNAYMQNLAGHTGVVVNTDDTPSYGGYVLVLILDEPRKVPIGDLEVINEGR